MTTKTISAYKCETYYGAPVSCGEIEIVKTDRKIEFMFENRYYTRVMWKASDGSIWVRFLGEFMEVDTEYAIPNIEWNSRFAN